MFSEPADWLEQNHDLDEGRVKPAMGLQLKCLIAGY